VTYKISGGLFRLSGNASGNKSPDFRYVRQCLSRPDSTAPAWGFLNLCNFLHTFNGFHRARVGLPVRRLPEKRHEDDVNGGLPGPPWGGAGSGFHRFERPGLG